MMLTMLIDNVLCVQGGARSSGAGRRQDQRPRVRGGAPDPAAHLLPGLEAQAPAHARAPVASILQMQVFASSARIARARPEGFWLQVRSFKRLREGLSEISGPRTLAGMLWRTLTARTSWLLKAAEVSSHNTIMCLLSPACLQRLI